MCACQQQNDTQYPATLLTHMLLTCVSILSRCNIPASVAVVKFLHLFGSLVLCCAWKLINTHPVPDVQLHGV